MKKIVLILFVLLAGISFSQVPDSLVTKLHIVAFTKGVTGVDSLQSYGATHYSDSVRYVDFKYQYGMHYITIIDTGASVVDTIKLYKGHIEMDNNGVVVDTTWDAEPIMVKDNEFTTTNILVNANTSKTYTIFDWSLGLMKIVRTNVIQTIDNITKFIVEAKKDK